MTPDFWFALVIFSGLGVGIGVGLVLATFVVRILRDNLNNNHQDKGKP